ncbi:alanine racemase [uncultured Friedmanniella sp.]|uniref:alanine racemase n=1 Tax=uncultured Friedmanniella sp. TaxID=335381 RepID=UPI0035C99461
MTAGIDPATARADIDLSALGANLRTLAAHAAPAQLMLVVKADAYGHGMLRCAAAARAAGVAWLGVATPAEALALREDGDTGLLLAWLYGVDEDLAPLVAADVDVSVQSADQVSRLVAAAAVTERRARVHLKVDTGLSRNGAASSDWPELFAAAAEAEETGAVEVVAVWSHLAAADEPGHPATAVQVEAFDRAWAAARAAGLRPRLQHLANSAGALVAPRTRYDLVRVGVAAYGVEPAPGLAGMAGIELRPVMTLRATLANVKEIPAGAGVSYGWAWTAPARTTVGLVPLGYADGIPRHAGNRAEVGLDGTRVPVRGRICMDQFVVELGADSTYEPGAEVLVFGPGDDGEPTAADWADWCDTIGYEIVTRIGPRVPRRYLGQRE